MTTYLLKRIALLVPTLLGIILLNFIIVQFAPGGPVENTIAKLQGISVSSTERISGSNIDGTQLQIENVSNENIYVGAQGLDPEIVREIEKMYGFDKPLHVRFLKMLRDYSTFNFGESFYKDQKVTDLLLEKLPVSISFKIAINPFFIALPSFFEIISFLANISECAIDVEISCL